MSNLYFNFDIIALACTVWKEGIRVDIIFLSVFLVITVLTQVYQGGIFVVICWYKFDYILIILVFIVLTQCGRKEYIYWYEFDYIFFYNSRYFCSDPVCKEGISVHPNCPDFWSDCALLITDYPGINCCFGMFIIYGYIQVTSM